MLDIMILVDRSGSMKDQRADHEGGINSFIDEQRKAGDDATLTLIQFDTKNACEVVYTREPIDRVTTPYALIPRGGTPLLDATGQAIAHLKNRHQELTDKPAVIVMIVTDGEENESAEWTKARVQSAVKECEKDGWTFLYLGANVDAFAEASQLGVHAGQTMSYAPTHKGIAAMYAMNSSKMASSRGSLRNMAASGGTLNMAETQAFVASSMTYTTAERDAAMQGDTVDPHLTTTTGKDND